jgi:hypothetical protein
MKRGTRLSLLILFSTISLSLLILFLFSIFSVSAATQQASSINITIDNVQRTLDSGSIYFVGIHTWTAGSSTDPGHNASQIWVFVQEGETTLLNALTSPTFVHKLCPNPSKPLTYASKNIPNPGHLATEIILSSGKSLQQAINDGDFCGCVPNTDTKSCGTSTTCATYSTITCQTSGLWPSCPAPTFAAIGSHTDCNGDDWHACDGAGTCNGLHYNGCDSCPSGTQGMVLNTNACNILPGWVGRFVNDMAWSSSNQNSMPIQGALCNSCVWVDPYTGWRCGGYDWWMRPNG